MKPDDIKICTGCGTLNLEVMPKGKLCCPDNHYIGVKDFWKRRQLMTSLLKSRNAKIELLEAYSIWLTKHGYLDTDWNQEPPYAIDEFMNTIDL